MNVLFLTLFDYRTIEEKSIYTDLLREMRKAGHKIYAISPVEKRYGMETKLIDDNGTKLLKLRIGNTQKTNIIEKGISTLRIEPQFIRAIKKYFADVKFDLVLYSTPPITLCKAIEYVKKRDNATTYLMLKDIFPQNAIDIGMLRKSGLKGIIYNYFRKKETALYRLSDKIGCMSPANVEYLLKHNTWIDKERVGLCPNAVEIIDKSVDEATRNAIRDKYGIPLDRTVFVYGGNLGKPQDIPFLIKCLDTQKDSDDIFFVIVGDGTEYHLLDEYIKANKPQNVKLYARLPREDYDTLVGACDVGMIFLDHRFTIPNFPSRMLSYMQAKVPVLAVTDANSDIGKVITEGKFGWWCESDSTAKFEKIIDTTLLELNNEIGKHGFDYLVANYDAAKVAPLVTGDK